MKGLCKKMNDQKHMPETRTDEITFFEIWKILVARKWVVLSAPIFALLLGALYLMQATVLYECSARILVGQIGTGLLAENPAVIVQKLAEKYRVYDKTIKTNFPRVSLVVHDKKDTNSIVQIKSLDRTAKGARLYLEKVVAEILTEQIALFEQEKELKQTRLKTLNDRLEAVGAFQQELEGRIARMDHQDPAQATVLAVEKGGFLRLASELERERHALQREMSSVVSYPAELLVAPYLPEKPIKPRRVRILLLSGAFGLVFGIGAAFFAEFVLTVRQRQQLLS